MAGQTAFVLFDPSTWVPAVAALTAGGLSIYTFARVFRRDSRNDNQEKLIDAGVQQLIDNLRAEVGRLTGRVESMEGELVRLHEERTDLLQKVAELEATAYQPKLI
jgi:predicted nuclease with TOPRIM domain